MANTTTEITWIHTLLKELGISSPTSDKVWCVNMSAMYLSSNPMYKLFVQLKAPYKHEDAATYGW
jgi:hypothetical protein